MVRLTTFAVVGAAALVCAACGRLSAPPSTVTGATPLPGGRAPINQPGGRLNLARNPSFELGIAPWAPYGSATAIRTTPLARHHGRHSALVEATSTVPYGIVLPGFLGYPAVHTALGVTAWVRSADRAKRVTVVLSGYTPKGELEILAQRSATVGTSWVRIRTRARVVHPNLQSLSLQFIVQQSIAPGDAFFIDSVVVKSRG